MRGGGVNCSRQASLSQFFSLLFSDHIVPPITDDLFFLIEWKKENIHDRICSTQMSISGLFANDWDVLLTQLQCPRVAMDIMQFYAIQTGLFSETISFWHLVVPRTISHP